jgi:hypothetical protein
MVPVMRQRTTPIQNRIWMMTGVTMVRKAQKSLMGISFGAGDV